MRKLVIVFLVSVLLMLSACVSQPSVAASLALTPTATTDLVAVQLTSMAATSAATSPTTAAASPSLAATAPAPAVSTAAELAATYDNAVPVEMQLLLGTLQLSGTDQAITKEQANTLLPLWTSVKTLSQSLTPPQGAAGQGQRNATSQPQSAASDTQKQLDALVKQIEAALTPAQIQAIAAMKITRESAMTLMQAQDITLGGPQAGNGGQPPQGTPPAGGPGASNGQPPSDGQQPANGQLANAPAGGGMVPSELIDAVILRLQKITAD